MKQTRKVSPKAFVNHIFVTQHCSKAIKSHVRVRFIYINYFLSPRSWAVCGPIVSARFLSFHFPRSFKRFQFATCFSTAAPFRRSSFCRLSSPFLRTSSSILLPLGRLWCHCYPHHSHTSPLTLFPSVFLPWFQARLCSWFPNFSRNWPVSRLRQQHKVHPT